MLIDYKIYLIVILLFCFIFPEKIFADKAYFNLSEETIKIETNFKGKEVIIFGLADPNFDTILILKGPSKNVKLSIKDRFFGIWIETKKFTYNNIPSIFFIASSSPINDILDSNIIRQKGLNFKNFNNKNLNSNNMNKSEIFENNLYNWDSNFIRKQKNSNFYKEYKLEIVDEKLFQARIFFPSNIIPGTYRVNILQVKNKKIINESNKNIIIKKTGIGNTIYKFAQNQPSLYGIICILFAIITGMSAAAAFRRL